jgi:hypothetical protein
MKDNIMTKQVTIKGELFWSKWMNTFNTKFNDANTKYECTIGNISDDDAAKLVALGIHIKNKPEMNNYIVGKSQYVFTPFDKAGKAITIDSIGNGTKVTAIVSSYEHRMTPKHGMAPSIAKLTVDDLVTYTPAPAEAELDDVL